MTFSSDLTCLQSERDDNVISGTDRDGGLVLICIGFTDNLKDYVAADWIRDKIETDKVIYFST